MSTPPAPADLSQRLAFVIAALQGIIAAHAGRHREAAALVLLVWPYLARLAARFAILARKVRAGDAASRPAGTRPACLAPRLRRPRLPQGLAWLIRLAPDTAQLGGQVRHLLADPEFSALLIEAPQVGRILRPLCRMLGILPDPDLPPALFAPPQTPPPALPLLETGPAQPPPRAWPVPPAPSPRRRARRPRCTFSPA